MKADNGRCTLVNKIQKQRKTLGKNPSLLSYTNDFVKTAEAGRFGSAYGKAYVQQWMSFDCNDKILYMWYLKVNKSVCVNTSKFVQVKTHTVQRKIYTPLV